MTGLIEDKASPKPYFVLRGHASEVQCLHFTRGLLGGKSLLLSGDAQGFVILWSMTTFRPLAIWQAHEKAILAVSTWDNRILTHGRDNKLFMWEILDLPSMTTTLPLPLSTKDARIETYQPPFMLCVLDVNSINFCQASFCRNKLPSGEEELLIAVPALIGSEYIDIYAFPSAFRLATRLVASPPDKGKLGNVMSVDFKYPLLAAGYENGSTALFEIALEHVDRSTQKQDGTWKCLNQWTAHREAVLSVVLDNHSRKIFSCGIDSRLISYNIATSPDEASPDIDVKETKHSGQQSMRLRSDGKLMSTAGWDSYARIYTTNKLKQVAVLGFHKSTINAIALDEKLDHTHAGIIALGSKDSKISLWKVF